MPASGWLVVVPWLRAFLVLIITCCFLAFMLGSFSTMAPYWEKKAPWNDYEDSPPFAIKYHALTDRFSDATNLYNVYYSSTNASLIFTVGATLMAALCTFALRSLPTQRSTPDEQGSGFHGAVRKVWLQVKKVLFFQLPPRRFLLWWCGGVTVLDAFLIIWVMGQCAEWAYELSITGLRTIEGYVAAGTFQDYYEDESVGEAKLEMVALRSGFMINAASLYMFYPIPRNSFLQALFRVDFSYLIKYHRWLGHLVLITLTIHGFLYYILWGIEHQAEKFHHWQMRSISYLAGSLSYIFAIILWCSSMEVIRRKYFEVFYRLHIVGALGFYIFGFMHYDGFWYYSAPGFMLYLLDLTFRLAQWMNVSIVTGSVMSESVLALHLKFTPDTKLEPNSFVFISCPDASRSQWHPFTLSYVHNSTHPHQPANATIYLKPYGKWVQAIVQRIVAKGSALVKIDGPYGGASSLVAGDCECAVIFAGGIGVTPMLGLLAALRERRAASEFHGSVTAPYVPKKVVFVWACRSKQEFSMLDEELLAEAQQDDSWLDIQLYYTGNEHGDAKQYNTHSLSKGSPGGSSSDNSTEGALSLEHVVKANNQIFPPLDRPELKLASPFFLKPSLLQGYGIGYPLWALVHVLGFFGAYFSVLTIGYVWTMESMAMADGPVYWKLTTWEMLALVVGTMGMPAAVIFPVYLWRRRKAVMAVDQAQRAWPSSNTASAKAGQDEEAGCVLSHRQGRPDIRSILKAMQKSQNHVPLIQVHAAGPPSMVRDVQSHCTALNTFIGKGPRFEYEIDSFSL